MKNVKFLCCLILVAMLLVSGNCFAKDYKVAVKQLPMVSDYFVSVIKAIIEASGNVAVIQVVPPARADYLISAKEVDVQFPIIVITDPKRLANLKYDFSTVRTNPVAFVLYSNKSKPVDIDSLRKGNPKKYKIEVDPSRMEDFDYPVIPSTNLEATMQKVASGAIDGAILAQNTGDPILKAQGAKTVARQLWFEFEEAFSIQKGAVGGEVDKMLGMGLEKLKANGKWVKLNGDMAKASKYNNWQP
jgi:hypothetical protein